MVDNWFAEAFTILFNDTVHLHCDTQNDHRLGFESTVTITIPMTKIKGSKFIKKMIKKGFRSVGIVLYYWSYIGADMDRFNYFQTHGSSVVRKLYDEVSLFVLLIIIL